MKALVYDEKLKLVEDYEKPTPACGEVLIKTLIAGICNTDYEITKGYMGYKGVLGHEFVGIVVGVGDKVPKDIMGKRVVGEINCACENCSWCYKDLQRHCPNRSTLGIYKKDGCFSEYFTLPYKNVFEISKLKLNIPINPQFIAPIIINNKAILSIIFIINSSLLIRPT